jgi:chromosome segregation ATPase
MVNQNVQEALKKFQEDKNKEYEKTQKQMNEIIGALNKNQKETEIQNKMEGHSSRVEQTENRISQLEEEMVIKGKTEELSVKQIKTCERNMQEFTDSIKRLNLRIMGIEEGEEVQAKGMHNVVNKIITENFPNLDKTMPIQV